MNPTIKCGVYGVLLLTLVVPILLQAALNILSSSQDLSTRHYNVGICYKCKVGGKGKNVALEDELRTKYCDPALPICNLVFCLSCEFTKEGHQRINKVDEKGNGLQVHSEHLKTLLCIQCTYDDEDLSPPEESRHQEVEVKAFEDAIVKKEATCEGESCPGGNQEVKVQQWQATKSAGYYKRRADVTRKIPKFWVSAILSHPVLLKMVSEEEREVLEFLKTFKVEEFDDAKKGSGYRFKFIFDKNPLFENRELVKEFQFEPNGESKSTSTEIKWKEGMDHSRSGLATWFTSTKAEKEDQVAKLLKDDLWPNALQLYLSDV